MSPSIPFPSLFIIGAQRCATSTLYGHLSKHPDIYMSSLKEPRFFSHILHPPNFKGPGDMDRINKVSISDQEQYLELFTPAKSNQLCGEATTTYLGDSPALNKIAEMVKHPRIIIILRNPLERAYSSYNYKRNQGLEPASSFEDALRDEKRRIKENWAPIWHYATRSKYLTPTQDALNIFGPSNVRVIRYESFVADPSKELGDLAEFLALKHPFTLDQPIHYNDSGSVRKKGHPSPLGHRIKSGFRRIFGRKVTPPPKKACSTQEISQNTIVTLQSEFKEDILGLEKLLNWELSDWLTN